MVCLFFLRFVRGHAHSVEGRLDGCEVPRLPRVKHVRSEQVDGLTSLQWTVHSAKWHCRKNSLWVSSKQWGRSAQGTSLRWPRNRRGWHSLVDSLPRLRRGRWRWRPTWKRGRLRPCPTSEMRNADRGCHLRGCRNFGRVRRGREGQSPRPRLSVFAPVVGLRL